MMWKVKIKSVLSIFFSKSNITSDWKGKIEIKLFIQIAFANASRLMGIICIHLMIYFLGCTKGFPNLKILLIGKMKLGSVSISIG